jgi:hypothetical protein
MNKEGLISRLFRPGMYVIAFDTMDADFAAAACRAYNDWLHDFIRRRSAPMFGAAMVSPHDVSRPSSSCGARERARDKPLPGPNIFNGRPGMTPP